MFTEIASDSVTYVLYIGTIVLLFSVSNPPSLPYNILSFKFEFKTCLFSDDSRFFCKLSFRFSIIISSSVLVHTVERQSNGFHFWVYVILKVFSFALYLQLDNCD